MYDVQCFLIIISTIKFIVYEIIFDVDAHVVWMKRPTYVVVKSVFMLSFKKLI